MRLSGLRPRLRTVLVAVNLVILLIPVGGVVLLRLYESALIRRTETALIAQGAVVAAVYRAEVERQLTAAGTTLAATYGRPVATAPTPRTGDDEDTSLLPEGAEEAHLNLATDPVYPRPTESREGAAADPIAVVAGSLLDTVLQDAQRMTLAGVRVTDASGVVVGSTRGEHGRSLAHRIEVRRALAGKHASLLRERDVAAPPAGLHALSRTTHLRVYVAMPVLSGQRLWGTVVLSRTPMSVAQSMYGIRWHIAVGAGILLGSIILVSAFTSYTINRPIHELIGQTERMALGDKAAMTALRRPGTYEVAQLSAAFARMGNALDQRNEYITAFAANVSHEFKTPLTSIRGTVELLTDHLATMSDDERNRFLRNLDLDAERLERLVSRLLELARADVVQPTGETCALAPVIERVVERYRADGCTIRIEPQAAVGSVRIAALTLESCLRNLLDNARRHGGDAVVIRIGTSRRGPDRVGIEVADDGPGISPGNLHRVFDPFFTTARAAGGTGLGLSIVGALIRAHGGNVAIDSRPGRTVVAVIVPIAES